MASVAEAQQSTQAALAAAIAARQFPQAASERASKLLSRLETPTRVTILGLPKSGKTGIFNLLAGETVLPEGMPATVQMVYGNEPKATVTLRDGSQLTLEGPHDMPRIASLAPVFIKLEHNIAALRKISLLEVVTSYDRVEQIQAIKWALKQTDIAIWCTDDFGSSEQALWMDAPDALKDHAILLRTRADALGNQRARAAQQLERQAGNEFAYFFAVSAHEAYAARAAAGGVNKAQLKSSGAMSVISTILRQIERGRQYTVDQAEILLHQHANAEPQPAAAPKPPVLETPANAAPAKPPALEAAPAKPPVLEAAPAKPPVLDTPPAPAPGVQAAPEAETAPAAPAMAQAVLEKVETEETSAEEDVDTLIEVGLEKVDEPLVLTPAETGALSDEERQIFTAAIGRLEETGAALSNTDEAVPADIIRISAKSISSLSDALEEADLPDTPTVEQFRTMALDASDLMQLLKIEGDESSAVDAVSAMLQLKRGFQARLAA